MTNNSDIHWIKDLARAEKEMEETGLVDFSAGYDPVENLRPETLRFLNRLKEEFIESANAFNQLKASVAGRIKIYGISKKEADFMIFRNGFKLIFSMKEPGQIMISASHMGSNYLPGQETSNPMTVIKEDTLSSRWGAFGDLVWTYQDQPIKVDYLVKHYLSSFVRESAK